MDVFRKPKQNSNVYIRNHDFELLHAGVRWSVLAWLACIWRAVYGVRLATFSPCCCTGVVVSARLTCTALEKSTTAPTMRTRAFACARVRFDNVGARVRVRLDNVGACVRARLDNVGACV